MPIDIGDAVLKITGDTGGLDKALDGVSGKLSGLGGFAKTAGLALAGVGVAAVGAGVAAVGAFAKTADDLDEMSTRTGISTKALQELQYAANLTGSSLGGMESAVKRMQASIMSGSDTLAEFGIDLTSLQGLGVEEQFLMIADLIAEIEDPTQRAAIAMDIFGKSGTDLIPMMAKGSKGLEDMAKEADSLGIIMDDTSIKAGGDFKDGLDKLQMALGGVTNQIGAALIPVLTPLIPLFMDLIRALPLAEFGELLNGLLPPLVDLFMKLLNAIPLDIMIKFVKSALIPLFNILDAILPVLEPIFYIFGQLLNLLMPVVDVLGTILSYIAQIIGSGLSSIFGGISNLFGGNFQYGGIVPGPIGQPVPIIAHGGEEFLGVGNHASGGTTITNSFNISELVVREEADVQRIARELYRMQRTAGRQLGVA